MNIAATLVVVAGLIVMASAYTAYRPAIGREGNEMIYS